MPRRLETNLESRVTRAAQPELHNKIERGAVDKTVPVVGYVAANNANPKRLEVFKEGLAQFGYTEGKNIHIEHREAVLDAECYGVTADLVHRNVDVIAAANVVATRAAAQLTKTIPIVMLGRRRALLALL